MELEMSGRVVEMGQRMRGHGDLSRIDIDARDLAVARRKREVGADEPVTAPDFEDATATRYLLIDERDGARTKPASHMQPVTLRRVIEQRQHLWTEAV